MEIPGIPIELNPKWLENANGLPAEAVDFAEKLGEVLVDMQPNGRPSRVQMTTSQVRNFFGEMRRIQMKGFEKNRGAFHMLKPKLAYAVARARSKTRDGSKIIVFQEVTNELIKNVNNQLTYDNFVAFMEAVVAYHKSYGGTE